MDAQVLVAGAGPTGLTLALDLARRGVGVAVVDKADQFPRGSRGDGIQPRTLEVFDDLGVLEQVLRAGIEEPLTRVYVGRSGGVGGPNVRAEDPASRCAAPERVVRPAVAN